MKVFQLTGAFEFGDGIGNHITLLDQKLKEYSYETRIYAMGIDPRHRDISSDFSSMPNPAPEDVVIYHMSHGTPMNQAFKTLKCRKIMMYHNITPPKFFAPYDREAAQGMSEGLRDVMDVRPYVDSCVAMSEYNKRDLIEMGYPEEKIWVMPSYLIPFEDYSRRPDPNILSQYSDGWTNILFVGRIAPNKKQEDVIRGFAWYKKQLNPNSRLILVGSEFTPTYSQALRSYVQRIGVQDVVFTGHISFEAIIAFYRSAHVFLCMSEHEGFCIPLVEAMYFHVPIIAYQEAAVPDTLGGSGILVDTKSPVVIGHMIDQLVTDQVLRAAVLERQNARLAELASYQSADDFLQYLNDFIYRRS